MSARGSLLAVDASIAVAVGAARLGKAAAKARDATTISSDDIWQPPSYGSQDAAPTLLGALPSKLRNKYTCALSGQCADVLTSWFQLHHSSQELKKFIRKLSSPFELAAVGSSAVRAKTSGDFR